MSYQVKGKIKSISDELSVSDKFKKRVFTLEIEGKFKPQFCEFQMTQDKCSILDAIKIGQDVTVYFELEGREWTSAGGELKTFNTLLSWKIDSEPVSSTPEKVDSPVSEDVPF